MFLQLRTWYNPCFYDQNTILTSSNTCDKITILTLSNPCCHDKLQLWLCQIPVVMIRSPFWLCQIPVVMIISPFWLCQIPVVMIKSPFWLCQIPLIKTSPFWLCLTSVVTTKITILTLSNPCHENITILTLSSPCHDKITILTLSNPCCHDKIQSWRLTNVSFLNTPTSQRLASASQPHFFDGDLARWGAHPRCHTLKWISPANIYIIYIIIYIYLFLFVYIYTMYVYIYIYIHWLYWYQLSQINLELMWEMRHQTLGLHPILPTSRGGRIHWYGGREVQCLGFTRIIPS